MGENRKWIMLKQYLVFRLAVALVALPMLVLPTGCSNTDNPVSPVITTEQTQNQADTTQTGRIGKPGAEIAAIGSRRYWVRNECWYALDRNWLYRGDDPNGPGTNGTMSNWNWLSMAADANGNGLREALKIYQGCLSDLIPCNCCQISNLPTGQNTIEYWVGRLSSDSYGLNWGVYKGKGHGGECPAFVTMAIYRATGGAYLLRWKWGSMGESTAPSAKNATPGDVVFYYYLDASGNRRQHIGICVKNDGSKITIVDSNYVGGDGQEVIARHDVSYTSIGTTWKMYSGAGRWY